MAVSGGPDSVALLRLLLELRGELGLVLSIVHFNHKLRGAESEQDEAFVRQLSAAHHLEIYASEADTARFAREKELSIEAAARELRYAWFGRLIKDGVLDKVATAHTLDDQAETVLLRIFRGTGTSGLSGIHPRVLVGQNSPDWKGIVRPLLSTPRVNIESYLHEVGQAWRTDSSNSETTFTRNRLRHGLLPAIKGFNPEVVESLANLAEIARAEDEFWSAQTAEAFVQVHHNRQLDVPELQKLPLALRRRVLRLAAIQAGVSLDFHHAERILHQLGCSAAIELPNGFRAVIDQRTLCFEAAEPQAKPCGYSYRLTIPGEIEIAELGLRVRAAIVTETENSSRYNGDPRLALDGLPQELMVRNWRPGDRFWPAHSRSSRKVKQLLQERHLPAREKTLWPVALAGEEIVWMRDFPVSARHVARQEKGVAILAVPLTAINN